MPSLLSQELEVGFLQPLFLAAGPSGLTENNPKRRDRVVALQFHVRGIYLAHMSTVRSPILSEFIVVFVRPSKQRPVDSRTASFHIRPSSLFRNTLQRRTLWKLRY
jgi:hypothetical protein